MMKMILLIIGDLQQNFQILGQPDRIQEHWQIHLPGEH